MNPRESPRLFKNPLLEWLSRPNAPAVIAGLVVTSWATFFYGLARTEFSFSTGVLVYFLGTGSFTLAEYLIHRYVYHQENYRDPSNWRFRIHGIHHKHPTDKERLALPLPLALILSLLLFGLFNLLLGDRAFFFTPGFVTGYALYLTVHYLIHTRPAPKGGIRILWKHHHIHHHVDETRAFGVTSPLWDYVFGTMPISESNWQEAIEKQ